MPRLQHCDCVIASRRIPPVRPQLSPLRSSDASAGGSAPDSIVRAGSAGRLGVSARPCSSTRSPAMLYRLPCCSAKSVRSSRRLPSEPACRDSFVVSSPPHRRPGGDACDPSGAKRCRLVLRQNGVNRVTPDVQVAGNLTVGVAEHDASEHFCPHHASTSAVIAYSFIAIFFARTTRVIVAGLNPSSSTTFGSSFPLIPLHND